MGFLTAKPTATRAQSSTFASSVGTLLTGTTINTKGAYVDVLTPTDATSGFLIVELFPGGVAGAQALVDIAVGGSGSEANILDNLGVNAGTGQSAHSFGVPIAIPSGSTIRARYQRSNASLTMRASVKLFSAATMPKGSKVTTYGATTGTSRGTSVDPGGSANTKGSWVQLSAATTSPITWMMLHIGNQANTARTDASYLVDVGVGAAASEVVIVPNLLFTCDDTADEPCPNYIGPFPISVPVGSRLAVRAQSSITDATDRLFDVIAYGGA